MRSIKGLECVTTGESGGGNGGLLTRWDWVGLGGMVLLLFFIKVVHPLLFGGVEQMEFLPLMLISLLVGCWVDCGRLMVKSAKACTIR